MALISMNLIKELHKTFGKNGLFLLGDGEEALCVDKTSTGILTLDGTLGGGLPDNKIIHVSGKTGTGKTSLCLQLSRNYQRLFPDKATAFIDVEGGNDYQFLAVTYGLDPERTLYKKVQPEDTAETVFDLLEWLANRPDVSLVILDSYPALVSEQDGDKDMKDGFRDNRPALLSRCLRRLTRRSKDCCPVVIINQLRMNQGAQGNQDPYTEPGGMAFEHFPSLHLRLFDIGAIKDGETIVGKRIKAVVKKARFSTPRKNCEWIIDFKYGIDTARSLVDVALTQGVIEKKGAWYYYGDSKYQGVNALLDVLRPDPAAQEALFNKLSFSTASDDEAEPKS